MFLFSFLSNKTYFYNWINFSPQNIFFTSLENIFFSFVDAEWNIFLQFYIRISMQGLIEKFLFEWFLLILKEIKSIWFSQSFKYDLTSKNIRDFFCFHREDGQVKWMVIWLNEFKWIPHCKVFLINVRLTISMFHWVSYLSTSM